MNSKVRGALLIVVLFVIASSVLFAQTREFDASHIDVTLVNPGPDGPTHVVIGTTLQVELEDPDIGTTIAIESALVDFSQFEGPAAETMVWDDGDQRWKAEYSVSAGSLENTTARVKITASKEDGDGQITQDDVDFTVNNFATEIEGLVIDVEVTDDSPTGAAIVGSTIQVSFTSSEIISAKVDFQMIGGGLVDMTQVDSTFTAEYTVVAGDFTGDYTAEVLAYVAGNPNPGTASADEAILVDNWIPDEADAFTGDSYLTINDDPTQLFIHSGDTITVNATLDTRVKKAKIDWGYSNTRVDEEYDVVNGVLTASYTPEDGELQDTDDFEIAIIWLKTENGNESDLSFSYEISGAQDGSQVAVDASPPDLTGGWDLYYNPSNGLRFSPDADSVDGYGTAPDTFTIMLKLPDWGVDGATEFTLRFVSENRLSFLKTYTAASPELTDNDGGLLEVLWDGTDANGDPLDFDTPTTIGITLWEVKDAAGNPVDLEYVTGNEFPAGGDITAPAAHASLNGNEVILNRIHVVVDNLAPEYLDNLALVNSNHANIIRLIDDTDDDGVWDDGEAVYYNTEAGADGSQQIDVSFRTKRQVTVDSNDLRHETQNYWIFAEQNATAWFYNGTDWEDMGSFDFATALHTVPFTGNAANSDLVNVTLDLGDEYDTPFVGAADPGLDYEVYAYVQDNAGNITKSAVVNFNIQHQFMKTPTINRIELSSIHTSVDGGLAQYNGDVKNFYLSAEYAPEDAPYTGEYYTSQDSLTFEIEVNDSTFLKDSDSVELRYTVNSEEVVSYLQKSDFVDNVATITIPVTAFTEADGALAPGILWGIGGNIDTTNYIQVTSFAIEYSVNGSPIAQSFVAEDDDEFYLIIPPKPNFPPTDPADYALTVNPGVFSPGNPMNTYDAETNYAFDGMLDSSELSFVVPEGDNILWKLEVLQGTEVAKRWQGRIASASNTPVSRTFENLSNADPDIEAIVANGGAETLTVKLSILPDPMSDLGYADPPSGITPVDDVTVDNQNPYIMDAEADIAGIANNVITLTSGDPIVSANANSFSFDLQANEALGTDITAGDGNWQILLKKGDNSDVTNSGNPVTAAITSVEDGGGNLYNITVEINGIAGITPEEAEDANLVLILPWDEAQNPGRYNEPTLPYAADMWHMDSAEYYLPINIVPDIPEISNVTINDPDLIFVPGEDLEVAWEMVNWEDRDIALTIELSVGTDVIGTATIDSGFAAEMNNVFTAFDYEDLDGETITATISGTVNYAGLVMDLVPQTATIEVDIQPVIDFLAFERNGEEIRTLMNGMDEITITAEITSPNALDAASLILSNDDIDLTGWTLPAPTITDLAGDVREVKWTGVAVAGMEFDPALLVSDFVLAASTPDAYAAEDYTHQMLLINDVASELKGVVSNDRTPYNDIDPPKWFAPEHNVVAEYSFVSFVAPTDGVAPILADFDEIEDNIASNLTPPSTSTITEHTLNLTSGSEDPVGITLYEYIAGWDIEPDVQSVWNRYFDGEEIAVTFEYELVTGPQTDINTIQVDLRVPIYENQLKVAVSNATPVVSDYLDMSGYLWTGDPITLALDSETGEWPAGQSIFVKYRANDGDGVKLLDAPDGMPDGLTDNGWEITLISDTDDANAREKIIKLSPGATADPTTAGFSYTFAALQDKVGHINYGTPANGGVYYADDGYRADPPVLNFAFSADYTNTHQEILVYKYDGVDRLNSATDPYVAAGQAVGLQIILNPPAEPDGNGRALAIKSIEVDRVEINDKYILNTAVDNWVALAQQDSDTYYLNQDILVANDLEQIDVQYRIYYLITYEDDSTDNTTYFESDVFEAEGIIDSGVPELEAVYVYSGTTGTSMEGYVYPGDADGHIMVIFTDSGNDNPDAKPTVEIEDLNQFVQDMPAHYDVPADNITFYAEYPDPIDAEAPALQNVWVADLSNLTIIDPGTTSVAFSYKVIDFAGNYDEGDRFVEIIGPDPIVPIIVDAKYLTQLADGSWVEAVVEALAGQTINSKIEVYIDAEFEQYIDDVWIDDVAGIDIPADYTIREADPLTEDGRFVAVFEPVVATDLVAGDITFTANTRRIPYNAEIFEHHREFTVAVDIMDFMADTPVVQAENLDNVWINDIISPNRDMMVSVDISDLGEDFAADLPVDISPWITLETIPAGLVTNVPAPVISGNHTATWNIAADDIDDLGITDATVKITYQNIYGQIKEIQKDINVDSEAPVLANMQLYLGDTMLDDTTDGNFFWADNWDKIRVNFSDLPTAVSAGLYDVDVVFDAHPLTYQYNPSQYPDAADALNTMNYSALTINPDGSGYVDITFSAPYTGTTLANGRYLISITNLSDVFGSSVDLADQAFDYQYEPAEMTFYIDGVANNNTINVSDTPISIIANTSSALAGLEGVEFRLYYDVDNSGDLTEDDLLVDLTSHLDPASDMEFPYDTLWNLDADEYKFVDEVNYDGTDFRGFILRASAITQTRDLYNYDHYIMVTDDVAPIPVPDLADITETYDYETHINTLNVNVDFTDRDVVSVSLDIFDADGDLVHTIDQPVINPAITNTFVWDFDSFDIGTYSTQITATDFIGNESMLDGPAITILNDSSNAVADIKMYNRIGINNEVEINDGSIHIVNPIDEYLIVEALITNGTDPLNGIAEVGFSAEIVDRTTGNVVATYNPLINDDAQQNHNFTAGYIPSHLILVENNVAKVRLAVQNADIVPFMNLGEDHEFRFRAEFIPVGGFTGIDLPEANRPAASFIVDQLAPDVVLADTSAESPISWADGHRASFSVTGVNPIYDIDTEIPVIALEWSLDGTTWFNVRPQTLSYDSGEWSLGQWRIQGGIADRFLGDSYEGPVNVRAIATDVAGNVTTTAPIVVEVDNNAPDTAISHVSQGISYLETTEITGNHISIASDGADRSILSLYVSDFDADAELPIALYQKLPGMAVWEVPAYNSVLNDDGMYEFQIPVNMLDQGIHSFVVSMTDALGNVEGDFADANGNTYDAVLTAAELDNAIDLTVMVGPYIVFDQVNTVDVVSDPEDLTYYAMALDRDDFTGNVIINLNNVTNVASLDLAWADEIDGTYTDVGSITPVALQNTFAFTMPPARAPYMYLKASAYDALGNLMSEGFVALYVDTTAPEAVVIDLTHELLEGKMSIEKNEDVVVDLNYLAATLSDFNDVASLSFGMYNTATATLTDVLTVPNPTIDSALEQYTIPAANLVALPDAAYELELVLEDFAGNTWSMRNDPAYDGAFSALYLDYNAPVINSVFSMLPNVLNTVAYNDADGITFEVDYTDVIGLPATTGALAVDILLDGVVRDTVTEYTVVDDHTLRFTWIPSDFDDHFTNGDIADLNLVAQMTLTDLKDYTSAVENFNITLTYGVPNTTRMMVVTDYAYDIATNGYAARNHYVDWNLPTPQVTAMLGTNQDNPQPLDLYAYLAHQSDTPNAVEFQWYDETADVWNTIGTDNVGQQWDFVDVNFLDQYQSEYHVTWDIAGMPTGDYQVKTLSHYNSGISETVVTLHIYNDTIVPNFSLSGVGHGEVERGETYTLALDEPAGFTGNADFAKGVVYMYRYVDAANDNTPTSVWMHFGNDQGTFLTDWVQGDYSFDWTVYPYYLYNNDVQIVAMALDQWGTATPLAEVLPNSQYVRIVNTLAPAVSAVNVGWESTLQTDSVDHTAVISATINTSTVPQDLVSVEFLHKLDGAADFTSFDLQNADTHNWTPGQLNNNLISVSAPLAYTSADIAVSGELKVITTDIFDNTNEAVVAIGDLPTGDFVLTMDGEELEGELERESTVVLAANPIANEIQSVEYHVPGTIGAITVNADPWTHEWDVPQDLVFGDTYQLIARVNDAAGNSFSYIRNFVITDHSTDIEIMSVATLLPTSAGVIDTRLHGDNIPVVVNVNDPAIPRVEFMLRAADADIWDSVAFVNVAANSATHIYDSLMDLPSGEYYIGVRAAAARDDYPVIADQVLITVDNDIAVTVNSSMPESDGYFDGNDFVVHFTVDSDDEIDENAVALEYNTDIEPIWVPSAVATYTTVDGIYYTATFANVGVPVDGYYNFRIIVADAAYPVANTIELDVAQNILVDTGDPEVAMVSINGETDLTAPIDIELGTQAEIVASAYDITGGQIHLIASGINRVEFYSGANMIGEVLVDGRSREAYTFVWDTTGLEINTLHQIEAVAYDNAGNSAATAIFDVNIVAPQQLEAYAIITAMDFDAGQANSDHVYARLIDWPNAGAVSLRFEYFNGTDWNHFADGTLAGNYYQGTFNAELMMNATALRVVVNENYDAPMPELAVSYNATDLSLEVVDPQITADIFYDHELRVAEDFQADPIVTVLTPVNPVEEPVYMTNGNQVAEIAVNPGINTYWAAVLDDNGNVQLNYAELNTIDHGTASDNGFSVDVPIGGQVYFQNVEPEMPLTSSFTALSPQHAVFVNGGTGNDDVTITLRDTLATEVSILAVYYDEVNGTWSDPYPVIDNGDGTVTVEGIETDHIITVLQYNGGIINAMFSSLDPVYATGGELWTKDNSEIKFFVYEGMENDDYIIPAALNSVTMYLDDVVVTPNPAFSPVTGLIGYTANGLAAGEHTIRLVVELDGFFATAEQTFHVDTTEPVITATGSQINADNTTISATILDEETDIMDVELVLDMNIVGGTPLTIPMANLTVVNDTYSYEISDEDLFTLGYTFSTTGELTAAWSAWNNLEMPALGIEANYTVDLIGPAIVFNQPNNGWWINPTENTTLSFDVIAPAGREIQDNLEIALWELINDPVNGNFDNPIQTMDVNPVSVNGNVYSYSIDFGYALAPNAHAVRLEVTAKDNYNVEAEAQQTYGIDYLAPIVWALTPVGDPINPDEFPVTYESAEIPYGTNVAIGVGFQDMQGFATQETGEWVYVAWNDTWHHDYLVYYTGASGLNTAEVHVSLNGEEINGTISGGAFTYNAGELDPGEYTVVATVADNAGNVGSMSYTFSVTGGVPEIDFDMVNDDNWLNTSDNNVLSFTVHTQANDELESVVANIYAEPGNIIIQGPITPYSEDNHFEINLLGGIVPAGSFAVRLEVSATDVYGGSSTSNQTYGIDNNAPQITLSTPAENAQFNLNSTVNILASITDQFGAKAAGPITGRYDSMDKAGSGIDSVSVKVIDPNGDLALEMNEDGNIQVISESMVAMQYGTYTIHIGAIDKAGNQSMISRDFAVTPAGGPAVSFDEIAGGWLNSNAMNHLGFSIVSPVDVSVIAHVFTNPADELLMGPLTVNGVGGAYTVPINGSMIPADQTSIRLQLTVSDQFGNVTEANYYYNVDKVAPAITILNPEQGAEFTYVDEATKVVIEAMFSDMMPGAKSASGSGIAASRLVVIDPDGMQVGAAVETGVDVTETLHEVDNLMLGIYTIRVTVWDNAGNQSMKSVNFAVVEMPAPPADLEITSAHAYPNPLDADTGARFSVLVNSRANVNVRIYDFAGREVRSLSYAGKTDGKSTIEIVFDGRNNDGAKLARGTYFARVIANDGMKTVEKVVKIAIRK